MDILKKAEEYASETIATRRDIHMYPEPGGSEQRTSRLVTERLHSLGIPCMCYPGYGVLGVVDSNKPGRTLALRCDMDALPVAEETGLPFASTVAGVAHLCGHDGHTASLLTAAKILMEHRAEFNGKIHLIFQPCEERPPGGARVMVKHGVMQGVDAIFGIHFTNVLETGRVSVEKGCRMAASLRVLFDILGKGGHGGMPHEAIDAVVTASAIVMNMQTLVSREIDVLEPLAVTVGVFNAGNAFNAVSEKVHMEAAIKYFNDCLTEPVSDAITRIATRTAEAYRAKCDVCIDGHCAPVVNDEALSALAARSVTTMLTVQGVALMQPMSASEDFSVYLKHAPGVFAFVGSRSKDSAECYPLHHPSFTIDEDALSIAAALYCQFAMDYLADVEG